jgi:hypothetical protein
VAVQEIKDAGKIKWIMAGKGKLKSDAAQIY